MLAELFEKEEEALKTLTSGISMSGLVPILTEASANYYLALIWSRRKNLDKAIRFAKKAYELNPAEKNYKKLLSDLGSDFDEKTDSSKNDLIFLGDQFFRSGNCLAAQAQYKTAFERDPSNGIAAFKAAKCLWALSQSQEAISWLDYAIKADPKITQAYTLQADYLSAQFDYTRAIQILNKAARLFSNNSEVLKGFGMVELRRNNLPSAIGFLQRSLKVFGTDTETLVLLAKAHGANNELLQAQRYAVRALELDSTNQEAHVVYAKILTQFQGLESGVVYLKDLVSRFSYKIDFRIALAELYKEQQKFRESQLIYSQVLQVEPRNKKALLGLGESLQAQGLRDKALSYYLSATLIDPADPEGLVRAGLLHLEAAAYKQATDQFQRAGKVNALYPKLNFYIGQAAFQAGDLNLALQAVKQEKKNNPNLSDPYILAAQIYTEQKQYQKCTEEYQQVIKMRPQGSKTYVNIAKCYRLSGSLDVAEAMVNIAATKESGNPEIYKEQGAIFEVKGDVRAAVASYNKYLALSPNAPDKALIESRITTLGRQ
jgi:tetratricopeptide (TPR) repeat protein